MWVLLENISIKFKEIEVVMRTYVEFLDKNILQKELIDKKVILKIYSNIFLREKKDSGKTNSWNGEIIRKYDTRYYQF